jgi:hypothetical protein
MSLNFPTETNTYAGYFNGTSTQYLTWSVTSYSSPALYFLSVYDGFCLEFFIKWATLPTTAYMIGSTGANAAQFSISTSVIGLGNSGYYSLTSVPFVPVVGTWYHIAWMGGNSTNYIAVNGVVTNLNDPGGSSGYTHNGVWNIGFATPAFRNHNCYVKDFRVTTGSTVYNTSGFTAPTTRLGTPASGTLRILTLNDNTLSTSTGTVANTGSFTFVSTEPPFSTYPNAITDGTQTWSYSGTKWSTTGLVGPTGPVGAVGTGTNTRPNITSVTYTNASYVANGATSVSTSGGYIRLTGTGFGGGSSVVINTTTATTTTFVNSTTINVAVPALSAGTYYIYLTNASGLVAVKPNGVVYA